MGFLSLIPMIFKFGMKGFGMWQDHEKEKQELKNDLEKAKLQKEKQVIEGDQQYDITALQESGFKDEYLMIVFTSPLLGYIVGSLEHVYNGDDRLLQATDKFFTEFQHLPSEYMMILGGIIIATYGLKDIFRSMAPKIMGIAKK